jgi:hypothetical protein
VVARVSLTCSDDISTPANTVDQNNNPGAIVHFAPPVGNEECGTITVDHCNDCSSTRRYGRNGEFPRQVTVCSFTVTVTPAGSAPTI